jgi:hypothetical protein
MSDTEVVAEPQYLDMANLRLENGWYEVSVGFTRILIGYAILIIGFLFAGFLVGASAFSLAKSPVGKPLNLGHVWLFYIGMGMFSIIGTISYCKIAMGHWHVLKHSPERFGARWLIFACMTCFLMGPATNTVCSFAGVKKYPAFKRGPEGFRELEFDTTTRYLQLGTSIITLSSFVLFILYLRAVARCFNDTGRVAHATIYLMYMALLIAGTATVFLVRRDLFLRPETSLVLAGGMLLGGAWYLYLIVSMRLCINDRMQYVRSPLEM